MTDTTVKMDSEHVILYCEETGKAIEAAFFVGGKWDVHWTANAALARMLTADQAGRISAELAEQGVDVVVMTKESLES